MGVRPTSPMWVSRREATILTPSPASTRAAAATVAREACTETNSACEVRLILMMHTADGFYNVQFSACLCLVMHS